MENNNNIIQKSETFIGLIQTTEGYRQTKMTITDITDHNRLNKQTCSTMGFRFLYGRTEQGQIFEFIKAGKFAKKDIKIMQQLGIVEAVNSWCWCPKKFLIPQGEAGITKSIELGKETAEHINRWMKAMYA